jgi:hypothetical protein
MPTIKESSDGESDPNTPTIKELRESQRAGSVGIGTNKEDYAGKMASFNHGTGKGEGKDEQFPKASEYSDGRDAKLPWE